MDYNLSEEHRMIRETVRSFAEREIKPIAQELDEKAEFSTDLTRKMGELGLFGIYLPTKYGGEGMDYLAYIIAVEELARIDGSQAATLAAHNSLGVGPLYYYGTEEQKMKYLPRLCTGEALWAFGLTEPDAGSDSRGSKTRATIENGEWVINGSKILSPTVRPIFRSAPRFRLLPVKSMAKKNLPPSWLTRIHPDLPAEPCMVK